MVEGNGGESTAAFFGGDSDWLNDVYGARAPSSSAVNASSFNLDLDVRVLCETVFYAGCFSADFSPAGTGCDHARAIFFVRSCFWAVASFALVMAKEDLVYLRVRFLFFVDIFSPAF
jgi:hypothetical protein